MQSPTLTQGSTQDLIQDGTSTQPHYTIEGQKLPEGLLTTENTPRDSFSSYRDSISGEWDRARRDATPSLGTVTQPDITSHDPPEDLKLRIRESYDAIAPSYNQWTLMHRGQRTDYTVKLIALLREEQVRRDEAKGIEADIARHPGHVGHAKTAAHTKPTGWAGSVKATSAAQPPESPGERRLTLITSVSEIPGYTARTRRPGITKWTHSSKGKGRHTHSHTHTRKEPSLLAEAGITIIRLNHMKALEVGCGDGIPVAETLLAEELHVVGVDISGTQIALCQAHFPDQTAERRASWMQKDMMALQFPREEFDAVVALYSLFHLPREEQTVFLARARQWLKPGGLILFNIPQEENEGEVEEHWLGLEKGWVYWSSWGEEQMIRFIEGLGGMTVVMKEVTVAEVRNPDPKFVWVIAKSA